jgi:CheY-like chemotaxis protein
VGGFLRKPLLHQHLAQLLEGLEKQPHTFIDTLMFHTDHAPADTGSYPDYRRFNVLLVEDNRVNRELALEILAKFRISADAAENGREALEMIGANHYDLILMDCQMPVMDGFECARAIRNRIQTGEMATVPIIALTANAMRGDRERCLDAGMDDYISKPLRLQDMRSMLKRWFEPESVAVPKMERAA